MQKRSKTAITDFSYNSDPAPSPCSGRDQLITLLQDHLALNVGGLPECPPIIVLVPDHVVFGRVMAQLLPSEPKKTDRQTTTNIVQMPSERFWASPEQSTFTFGEISVNMPGMEVRRNGKLVVMPMKEFSMLVYMLKNAGRVLARNELLDEVWGYNSYPFTRTVDNHIVRLRRKLEVDPSRPKHFLTIRCAGYKFVP
jgi:hypothetical protein